MTNDYGVHPSATLLDRLRELMEACGPTTNKHDLAIVLIMACIEEGVATRPRIVGALKCLGFDYRHVAMTLKQGTGENPERHRWRLDGEGQYSLHDDER